MENHGVTLSDNAAKRILRIIEGETGNKVLRVSVKGGGCSGFSYQFNLVENRNDDDFVIENAGAIVVVDETSMQFMGGSEIDFVDNLIGQSFQINNPNVTASCGCGTSFSI